VEIHVEIKDSKEEFPGSTTHILERVCIRPSVHIILNRNAGMKCAKGSSFVHLQTFLSHKQTGRFKDVADRRQHRQKEQIKA